jgi:hypothetical protein
LSALGFLPYSFAIPSVFQDIPKKHIDDDIIPPEMLMTPEKMQRQIMKDHSIHATELLELFLHDHYHHIS